MPTNKAKVVILDQTRGTKSTVILPTNVPMGQLGPALVRSLGLPTEGPGGAPMQYNISVVEGTKDTRLTEDQTLEAAGIRAEDSGRVLSITPDMRAGAGESEADGPEATRVRYFKLWLTRLDGAKISDTDLPVSYFSLTVRGVVSILVERGLLHEGEPYQVRIIPRTDSNPDAEKPQVIRGKDVNDDGHGHLDIMFDRSSAPVDSITYLTMLVLSKETDLAYRVNWRPSALLGRFLVDIVQRLLDKGIVQDGEHFRLALSAHDDGVPEVSAVPVLDSTPPVEVPGESGDGGDAPAPDAVTESLIEPAAESSTQDFEIVIESVEELVRPEHRSMARYVDVEYVGDESEQDLTVFVARSAREHFLRSARLSARSEEEVGGFLLGNVYRDPDTERLFIDISEVVEADKAHGTYVSLDFTYDAWRQVLDRIDKEFTGRIPVGWYHTHLVSRAVVIPVAEASDEYVARYVPFFSQSDSFIHRNFFPDPWHVGLVIDLRCAQEAFFAWHDGELAATAGFRIYGDAHDM